MYNGIFCEAIWGTLPFEKLFCLFPLTRSSFNSFGELPWLYQGLTLCVQGVYPNYTSPYACLYNGCPGVSFVKQFNNFSYLDNSLSHFPQLGLPLIVLGNYHDCTKVLHHVCKECILTVQVHMTNYTMVSFVKQFEGFSHLNKFFVCFSQQIGLLLIVLGNYCSCTKVLHHIYKECTITIQVHIPMCT